MNEEENKKLLEKANDILENTVIIKYIGGGVISGTEMKKLLEQNKQNNRVIIHKPTSQSQQ